MANVVNFNKLGSVLVGELARIRIRVRDGVVEFRPTDRVSGKLLPKGEFLVDVRRNSKGANFRLPEGIELPLGNFEVSAAKHGWLRTQVVEKPVLAPGQAAPAGGNVAER